MDYVYKKSSRVVAHTVGEEVILVPLRRAGDLDCLYRLNDVAAFVWERIDGELTVAELARVICGTFAVDLPQVERDLLEFLQCLQKIGAIKLLVRRH